MTPPPSVADAALPSRALPTTLHDAVSDIDLIHRISLELIGELDVTELYGKIVDAAVSITGAQFGTMQRVRPSDDTDGHGGELELLAHRGLPPEAIAFWSWVPPAALSSCTQALKLGERAIIPDFETWGPIAGTEDLFAFRRTGIRSAQTTPLLSRNGTLLGMISTHWNEVHTPSPRDLRLLDILARQAADLLERTIAEEAMRKLNETLEVRVEERTRELLDSAEQIRHMQKMEAIGQLTGGVAHDFNNLLTVIRMSVDVLGNDRLSDEKRQKYVVAISDTADRAARLTGQLLAFARRQALRPEVFDAAVRVGSIADMLKTILGSRIRLTIEQMNTPCFVEADTSQFDTALVNMTVNARDAMDGEGSLVIAVDTVTDAPCERGNAAASGAFVRISVTDTGTGMTPDQINRVFEPFFTTKEQGKGTGLGLSQVHGFIKQSGGEIQVTSQTGTGTTFSVYLPKTAKPEAQADVWSAESEMTVDASILIVEDNAQVGEFASQLLGELGYTTRYAKNADEALAILTTDHASIDIVFTDVVMPGTNGVDLARQVRASWPKLGVLLTSGYSHVLAADAQHGFRLLHKPYSVAELSLALRRVRMLALPVSSA